MINVPFEESTKVRIFLFVCAFALVVLSDEVLAKITPKKVDEPTKVYIIKKGDKLKDLAVKYFGSSEAWRNFEKYNNFSDIDKLSPGEKLQVPLTPEEKAKAEAETKRQKIFEAKKAVEDAMKAVEAKVQNKENKDKNKEDLIAELQKKLDVADAEIKSLKASLIQKEVQLSELKNSIDKLEKTFQIVGNQVSERIADQVSKSLENALAASAASAASREVPAQEMPQAELEKIHTENREVSEKVGELEAALKAQSGEISKLSSQIESLISDQVQGTSLAQAQPKEKLKETPKEAPKEMTKEETLKTLKVEEKPKPFPSKRARSISLITALVGVTFWIMTTYL